MLMKCSKPAYQRTPTKQSPSIFAVEYKVEFEQIGAVVLFYPIGHERFTHAKHGVGIQPGVTITEHMSDQGFVAGSVDLEMQVCGAPGMAIGGVEQLAYRAIVRNLIGHGHNTAEMKAALVVGM